MSELFAHTIFDLIGCAEREVKMRENVYPRWVERGRMTQGQANREIALMKAIVAKLKGELEPADTMGAG